MNRIALVILFLVHQFSSFAQEIKWQNTIGGNGNDVLYTINQTIDGGFICGGASNSSISGDKTENGQGSTDFWVINMDSSGVIQWQNTIGGSSEDIVYSIEQTTDGGYICGGSSNSNISGDKTENSNGMKDYWVVKLNSSGIIQWQNTIGGNKNDILLSIHQTADGGYICGGRSSSDSTADKTEGCLGATDYWIIKLDSIGDIEWQNTIGGDFFDDFTSLDQTVDGGYICAGSSSSPISGDKTEDSQGQFDYWIFKLDSSGTIEWQNTIGGSSYDYLFSVVQTTDGGYTCGGQSISPLSGDKTEASQGVWDYWIVRLDSSGNILMQNTFGGSGVDNISSIYQTLDGGYICGGNSQSNISGDKTEGSQGSDDFYVVKLDSLLNIEWQNSIGGSVGEVIFSIIQTADTDYVCGGWSESGISGDKTEICQGSSDFWVLKLTSKYNLIQGELFVDINADQFHDPGEPPLKNILVSETQTGRFGFTGQSGKYNVVLLNSGNYTVASPVLDNLISIPLSHSANFSSILEIDSLNDFAYQPTGPVNDLQVTITPVTSFRPGFNASYYIHYKNAGPTSLMGTVIFYPDSGLTYISSSVTPGSVTSDSVVWQTSLLNSFDEGAIIVTVNVNSGILLGELINSCVTIEPVSGDATPTNNQSCQEVIVTGPLDPNDILVNRTTISTTEILTSPYLEYIIRFQNTGTDTAFNVKILNPIDLSFLQLNTFEFITASHPVDITWLPWERNFEFKFNNILLPDSNINEPSSHGFVRYRIRPNPLLSVGDLIRNKVYIYFDFNAPVATNTAITEIVLPTFIPSLSNEFDFFIYPNPAINKAAISMTLIEDADVTLQVFNSLGQMVKSDSKLFSSGKNDFHISTQTLPEGIYFIKVSVDENFAVKKLVIFD